MRKKRTLWKSVVNANVATVNKRSIDVGIVGSTSLMRRTNTTGKKTVHKSALPKEERCSASDSGRLQRCSTLMPHAISRFRYHDPGVDFH